MFVKKVDSFLEVRFEVVSDSRLPSSEIVELAGFAVNAAGH